MFTIDLKSKDHLKSLAIPHDREGSVLIIGALGVLNTIGVTEDSLLEVGGENGFLRLDISKQELMQLLSKLSPQRKNELIDE